jgi:hypothetical protein
VIAADGHRVHRAQAHSELCALVILVPLSRRTGVQSDYRYCAISAVLCRAGRLHRHKGGGVSCNLNPCPQAILCALTRSRSVGFFVYGAHHCSARGVLVGTSPPLCLPLHVGPPSGCGAAASTLMPSAVLATGVPPVLRLLAALLHPQCCRPDSQSACLVYA